MMNKGLITINDSENKVVVGDVALLLIYEREDFKYYITEDLEVWSACWIDGEEPSSMHMTLADFLAEGE